MDKKRITLKDAIRARDLEAFVAQAEADGMPPADAAKFAAAITAVVKPPRSKRRTSRSRGDLAERKFVGRSAAKLGKIAKAKPVATKAKP